MTFSPGFSLGPFLPINKTFSQDWDQFLLQVTKFYADTARYLNMREIAIFDTIEFTTGEQWFNPANVQIKRNGYRQVYSFGAIVHNTSLTIPHNISGFTQFTHIYSTATTVTPTYIPIPYVSGVAAANDVSITVDNTNIVIANGNAAPDIVSGIVVLEYLKN